MRAQNLVFDGRHMLYRTSDAFRTLTVDIGDRTIGTGGMYGFLSVAVRIFRRYGGRCSVAWEGKRSRNFRRDLYPMYKYKPEPDEDQAAFITDMWEQERRLQAMLRAMGVRQFQGDNCEADDVMAWLATQAAEAHESLVIYTGDSDLRQLVDGEYITVVAPGRRAKDVVYGTLDSVEDKHGVGPHLLADLKALAGDSSDNVPGVRGIGPKTAAILLNHYGSLEMVLAQAAVSAAPEDWPVAVRHQDGINACHELEMYKVLTSLQTSKDVIEIARKRSQKTLVRHFRAYRFRSLLAPNEMFDLMNMGVD